MNKNEQIASLETLINTLRSERVELDDTSPEYNRDVQKQRALTRFIDLETRN